MPRMGRQWSKRPASIARREPEIPSKTLIRSPQVVTHIYPGLNHLFTEAPSGHPSEYGLLKGNFSQEVLEHGGMDQENRRCTPNSLLTSHNRKGKSPVHFTVCVRKYLLNCSSEPLNTSMSTSPWIPDPAVGRAASRANARMACIPRNGPPIPG